LHYGPDATSGPYFFAVVVHRKARQLARASVYGKPWKGWSSASLKIETLSWKGVLSLALHAGASKTPCETIKKDKNYERKRDA
jgi:hypothetical protein